MNSSAALGCYSTFSYFATSYFTSSFFSSSFFAFFFFFFFSPYSLAGSLPAFNSFNSASSSSFSCCFLDFLGSLLVSTSSTGFSSAGFSYSGSCLFSLSLSESDSCAKANGFLTVSRWNFFFSNFSALKPPLTVLRCAKSPPLNFFLASKGTILASFFLGSSLFSLISAGSMTGCVCSAGSAARYYRSECSDSD